ncbi:NAD(P)H-quinone oxidoreductase [Pseudoalteromonas sp. T1lg65]|uniref:NAD(P)H-quinone oxidoreductase n=1 Tax=Pseudoalteromonas sp. T1lg65 TaxID=2077101 RepID=UPI003F7AC28E
MAKGQIIPKTMRYISFDHSTLSIAKGETPCIGAEEVLIQVVAFGVNRADLLQRQGKYPAPAGDSPILGLEVAGIVVKVGDAVSQSWLGKSVFCLTAGGGYAEYAKVDAKQLMEIPKGLSFTQAAGLAEVYLTAFDAIVRTAQLSAGQVLLVHGGASGVGSAAIRLAKKYRAVVVTTQSSDEKSNYARQLGADHTINYRQEDFSEAMKSLGLQANVILDPVAGDYLRSNLRCAALDCHCIVLAMLGGRYSEIDFAKLLAKRFNLHGSTLRNRSIAYKRELVAAFSQDVLADLHLPEMAIPIYKALDWHDIEQAHEILQENKNLGKVVVRISD